MADDQSPLPSPERVIDAFQAFHRTDRRKGRR
jgi:hypothetical protein